MAIESREFISPRPRHRANPRAYHEVDSPTSTHLREVQYKEEVLDAGRGEAIQSLTHNVLVHRSLEVSPNGFITIISIIQGVALALLAQNTFPKPSGLVIVQSITLMLVFVVVFYYYLTMSILLRWAPSFVDCFLPFAIAGLEIPPAFFLGNAAVWNAWLAALWLFVAIGLWITTKWAPPSHFGKVRKAHKRFLEMQHELGLCVVAGGFTVGACAGLAAIDPAHQLFWGLAGAAAVLAVGACTIWRIEIRSSQIHALYGVNRPPFN
ncbi:hypothetical protein ACIA5D_50490 [Actinoplanes sp. NPDC051513]|uniref:hypothetical protein n=1 Tax=Actinoplanes sp. NPDC051513 TaxID=3363908 RepID=UPI0037A15C2C